MNNRDTKTKTTKKGTVKNIDKADCMFQYATRQKVIKDTGLITRVEADKLLTENLDDVKKRWNDFESPQIGIWVDCDTETDYHTMAVDIDFRDCELEGGHFYRVTREKII